MSLPSDLSLFAFSNCECASTITDISQDITRFLCTYKGRFKNQPSPQNVKDWAYKSNSTYLAVSRYLLPLNLLEDRFMNCPSPSPQNVETRLSLQIVSTYLNSLKVSASVGFFGRPPYKLSQSSKRQDWAYKLFQHTWMVSRYPLPPDLLEDRFTSRPSSRNVETEPTNCSQYTWTVSRYPLPLDLLKRAAANSLPKSRPLTTRTTVDSLPNSRPLALLSCWLSQIE